MKRYTASLTRDLGLDCFCEANSIEEATEIFQKAIFEGIDSSLFEIFMSEATRIQESNDTLEALKKQRIPNIKDLLDD